MNLKVSVSTQGALLSGKAPAIIQSHLDQAITEATLFLDAKVKANTPQGVGGAQGGLLATIDHDVLGKGTPIVKGIVFHTSKHGDVIEKGRKPGKGVPRGVLTEWIQKKLGITGEEELASVSFLISRKIKLKGFKGAHMFEKAFNDSWPAIQRIFDRHGIAIARELNE